MNKIDRAAAATLEHDGFAVIPAARVELSRHQLDAARRLIAEAKAGIRLHHDNRHSRDHFVSGIGHTIEECTDQEFARRWATITGDASLLGADEP